MTEIAKRTGDTVTRYRVRSIAPLQAGKMMGGCCLGIALAAVTAICVIETILFIASTLQGRPITTSGIPIYLLLMVAFAALYGALGFIIGTGSALFYNALSKHLGGLELELISQDKDTPP